MQVTELNSEGLKKNFKIVVDKDKIQAQMEVELRAAGEQVKIPGFRPGYIPMKVLQQRYGKAVQSDVLKQVINDATNQLVVEKKFRVAITPQINVESYQEGGELAFTVAIELFPQVPDMDFESITLNRKVYEIGEPEVDKTMETIGQRNPKLVRVAEGTAAALGNVLAIDFKGTIDGVAFNGGTASGFRLELGSGQFIEGFEEQLVGIREGDERTVSVTFPADYPAADLAGKQADFAVKVHEVLSKEPVEMDDEFAKSKGFNTMQLFRDAVRAQMVREYDMVVRNQLKKELFDQLEQEYAIELPPSMLEMEFNSIWQRLQEAKQQGDESLAGKTDDELRTEYHDIAKRRVKLGLLLAEVGSRHNLQISREELTRAVMQQASQYPGQENRVLEFYRKNPERMDELRGPILEEKAVDFILGKVKIIDHKVSLEELLDEDDESYSGGKPRAAKDSNASKAKKTEEGEGSAKKTTAKKKATK